MSIKEHLILQLCLAPFSVSAGALLAAAFRL